MYFPTWVVGTLGFLWITAASTIFYQNANILNIFHQELMMMMNEWMNEFIYSHILSEKTLLYEYVDTIVMEYILIREMIRKVAMLQIVLWPFWQILMTNFFLYYSVLGSKYGRHHSLTPRSWGSARYNKNRCNIAAKAVVGISVLTIKFSHQHKYNFSHNCFLITISPS